MAKAESSSDCHFQTSLQETAGGYLFGVDSKLPTDRPLSDQEEQSVLHAFGRFYDTLQQAVEHSELLDSAGISREHRITIIATYLDKAGEVFDVHRTVAERNRQGRSRP